jgi:hypothetical protein
MRATRSQHTTLASHRRSPRDHPVPRLTAAVLLSALLMSCSHNQPTAGPHAITLTFIRHGQSAGNASGLVDTSVPGPGLTALGRSQALTMATGFSADHDDGVFASTMVRTQQTANYLARRLNKPVTVLAGLARDRRRHERGKARIRCSSSYFRCR